MTDLLFWFLTVAAALPGSWSAREKSAATHILASAIGAHVRFLADDLLEGRAPASRGSHLAMRYVSAELDRLGVEPAGEDHGWLQSFDLVDMKSEVTTAPIFT